MIKTIAVGFTPVPKKSEAERRISNFENCGVIDSENVDDKKSQDPEKAPELKQDQNSENSVISTDPQPFKPAYKKRVMPFSACSNPDFLLEKGFSIEETTGPCGGVIKPDIVFFGEGLPQVRNDLFQNHSKSFEKFRNSTELWRKMLKKSIY